MAQTSPISTMQIYHDWIMTPLQVDMMKYLATCDQGAATRDMIVKKMHKPRTTIYDNLLGLIEHGLVKKFCVPLNQRGRPCVFFIIVDGGFKQ